ncbi:MAG: DUF5979 domain-containing protein, partial [Aristaeellaceae bacterium]
KITKIENPYSAGTPNITKSVTGNLGDKSKYFEFTVTLTGDSTKTYADSFTVTGGSNKDNPDSIELGKPTKFYLKDGEALHIANLPYGVNYTVEETSYADDGYTTTKTGDTGAINDASQTAAFVNDKDDGSIDTGITVDTLPYVLLMGIVLLAGAAMIIKRRAHNN